MLKIKLPFLSGTLPYPWKDTDNLFLPSIGEFPTTIGYLGDTYEISMNSQPDFSSPIEPPAHLWGSPIIQYTIYIRKKFTNKYQRFTYRSPMEWRGGESGYISHFVKRYIISEHINENHECFYK